MNPHRDVFKVLHPTLEKWLDEFDKDCCGESTTQIYKSLVMLGIQRPDRAGCDCLTIIAEEQRITDEYREFVLAGFTPTRSKAESIQRCTSNIEFYTSKHATHVDFNHRVHFLLRNACRGGIIAKVRAVCLRDLRIGLGSKKTHIVAEPSYGRELATFLINEPKGWW